MDDIKKSILKIFVAWTKLKVMVHFSEREIYPKTREIWWASLGQNIGVEINGKNDNFERPVVIIKVFNKFGVLHNTNNSGSIFFNFSISALFPGVS